MTAAVPKRGLSAHEIGACENARKPGCQCRCGGEFHGVGRLAENDVAGYRALPTDDPHHMPTEQEARVAARIRRTHRKHALYAARRGEALRLFWIAGVPNATVCAPCLEDGLPPPAPEPDTTEAQT